MKVISKLVVKVRASLDSDFQRAVFDGAINCLGNENDPLRVNTFATALRELVRLILRDRAPDSQIKNSDWYKPEYNENGKEVITRSQRVRYAIQAGLPTEFVQQSLGVDVTQTIKELNSLNSQFSKYTHIEEDTFNVSSSEAEQFAEDALETFVLFYETIDECKVSVQSALETYARREIEEELVHNVTHELDQLATHYWVDQVNLNDVTLEFMDSEHVTIAVGGTVDCVHQYGSDSDFDRGDGVRTSGNYPFAARYRADITNPCDLRPLGSLSVDNSSFYE